MFYAENAEVTVRMGGEKDTKIESKDPRKLTKAELRRKEIFEKTEQELLAKGYTRVDLTISLLKANTLGVLITLPFLALLTLGYLIVNYVLKIENVFNITIPDNISPIIFMVATIVLIVVHEGIHGLTWSFGAPNHLKDIEFGFVLEMLTPYATCKAPLKKSVYLLGSLMPMTLLGIIPGIISIFFGDTLILGIFLIQTLAGSGDFLISCMLLKHKTKGKDVVLLDHPYECGLVVFEK